MYVTTMIGFVSQKFLLMKTAPTQGVQLVRLPPRSPFSYQISEASVPNPVKGFSCASVCLRILVREENSLWGLILKSLVHKYTMAWIIYLFVGPIRTPDGDMEMKIKVLALIYTPSHF